MKRITKCITWCAVVVAALLLAPHESLAFDARDFGISDSSSFAEVTAQIDKWVVRVVTLLTRYAGDCGDGVQRHLHLQRR